MTSFNERESESVTVKSVNFWNCEKRELLEKWRTLTFKSVNAFKTGLKVN